MDPSLAKTCLLIPISLFCSKLMQKWYIGLAYVIVYCWIYIFTAGSLLSFTR